MKKSKTKKVRIRKPHLSGQKIAGVFIVGFSVFQLTGLTNSLVNRWNEQEDTSKVLKAESSYDYKSCNSSDVINSDDFNQELTPELIKIEKVGIDLPIVSVPLKNGTWKVNAGVANYAQETSLINTKSGNVGIYAHDRQKEFANIKNLNTGDIIEIFASGHKIKYRIESQKVLDPENVGVFYPTSDPTLTLVTCDGDFSEQRYVVKAKLVEIEELNCN